MRHSARAGVTLIEVLIAVMLLSLLSIGMLFAMRIGLNAWGKANTRLMSNRRAAGAQRVMHAQIEGLMPVSALCEGIPPAPRTQHLFFHGEPQSMRFVSSYSLQEAWRGAPRILEFQVISRPGGGMRLIVNETPFTGPEAGAAVCLGIVPDPVMGTRVLLRRIEPGPQSFVLADNLQACRFSYMEPDPNSRAGRWRPDWALPRWPLAVRVELASTAAASDLRPVTFVAPIHIRRSPEIQYVDF